MPPKFAHRGEERRRFLPLHPVTGAGDDGVFRHAGLEAALSSNFSASAVDGVAVSSDGLMGDIHGSAEYKAALIKAMTKKAVAAI